MKKVEAVIQPHELSDFTDALYRLGVAGITVSDVRDYVAGPARKSVYRGATYELSSTPKVKLEMLVPAFRVEEVFAVLSGTAQANTGDRIIVYQLD
jgi:nitrogen regulatory protein P-II 1